MPSVSVLFPVYNAADTVADAARSILDGQYDDLELLVIDDGSTDDTAVVLEALADPRLRVHRVQHGGLVAALNTGIALCDAPCIARMDGDDIARPDRLTRQLEYLQHHAVDAVGSAVRIVDQHGRAVESMQRYQTWINGTTEHDQIAAMRFVESPLVHPTVTARREVFELGYRDGEFPEDYDLWLRAIAAGFRFAKIDEPLLDWVDRPGRLTRCHQRYTPQAFDNCRRMHLLGGPLKGVSCADLWGAGKTGKPWLRWLQSVAISVRQVYEIDPRKLGQRIHGTAVVHPDDMQPPDGTPMLIAVGAQGARELIQPHLQERGYRIGHDAWFVA